jgi:hypothetical protein
MSVQVDAYIDPATGDLPDAPRLTTGIELIEQRIRLRLLRGTGEWFLDPSVGLPLIAWRQMKPPDKVVIRQRVEQEIRAIPGVLRTARFVVEHEARRITISGDVIAADGAVTSLVVHGLADDERNAFAFQVFFTRGSGSIARPTFRGP